jgi:hypothetical protein
MHRAIRFNSLPVASIFAPPSRAAGAQNPLEHLWLNNFPKGFYPQFRKDRINRDSQPGRMIIHADVHILEP